MNRRNREKHKPTYQNSDQDSDSEQLDDESPERNTCRRQNLKPAKSNPERGRKLRSSSSDRQYQNKAASDSVEETELSENEYEDVTHDRGEQQFSDVELKGPIVARTKKNVSKKKIYQHFELGLGYRNTQLKLGFDNKRENDFKLKNKNNMDNKQKKFLRRQEEEYSAYEERDQEVVSPYQHRAVRSNPYRRNESTELMRTSRDYPNYGEPRTLRYVTDSNLQFTDYNSGFKKRAVEKYEYQNNSPDFPPNYETYELGVHPNNGLRFRGPCEPQNPNQSPFTMPKPPSYHQDFVVRHEHPCVGDRRCGHEFVDTCGCQKVTTNLCHHNPNFQPVLTHSGPSQPLIPIYGPQNYPCNFTPVHPVAPYNPVGQPRILPTLLPVYTPTTPNPKINQSFNLVYTSASPPQSDSYIFIPEPTPIQQKVPIHENYDLPPKFPEPSAPPLPKLSTRSAAVENEKKKNPVFNQRVLIDYIIKLILIVAVAMFLTVALIRHMPPTNNSNAES